MVRLSLKSFLRKFTITQRIILWVLLICLIPLILVGSLGYSQARTAVGETADIYNRKVVDSLCKNVSLTTASFYSVATELMGDSTVRSGLKTFRDLGSQERYNTSKKIHAEVKTNMQRIPYVYDIRIVTLDNLPIYTTGYLFLNDAESQEVYSKISGSSTNLAWFLTEVNGEMYYVMATKVIDIAVNQPIGYLFVYIMPSAFEHVFEGFDFGTGEILLMDSFGSATSGRELRVIGPDSIYAGIPAVSSGEIQKLPDSRDLVYYANVSETQWTLITYIPSEYVNQSVRPIQIRTITLVCITIALCLLLSRAISQSITTPIKKMNRILDEASKMRFQASVPDNSKDELGYMSQTTEKIITQMKGLIQQVEGEQEQKRKAEIRMLQAQINPHFLFNTLDSLRFMALMSQAESVSDGISSLSHLLRSSIYNDSPYVSIQEEMDCIHHYIQIQKMRYGEVILLEEQIEDRCRGCGILKLMLQPIIENSIIHGAYDQGQIMHIQVRIASGEGLIHITITDDGRGCNPQQAFVKGSKMSGIGLDNIRDRLRLEYGDNQCFIFDSQPGQGTSVTLAFPILTPDAGGNYVQSSDS